MNNNIDNLIDRMIAEGIVVLPDKNDFNSWYLTRRGEKKLSDNQLILPADSKSRVQFLRESITSGVLLPEDIHMKLLALPEVIGIPGLREDVADSYAGMIKKSGVNFDRLCSLAYAGIGIGDLTASKLGVPHAQFRKEQEARHKPTVGKINEGDTVALLDDVLYQGDAIVRGAAKLRECNAAKVHDAFVFLDRSAEGGGKNRCLRWGVNTHSQIDTERLKHTIKTNNQVPQDVKDLL